MDEWDGEDPYFWRWGRNKPIKVQGGIRAQTKAFGKEWWTQKWLEAVESFGPTKRLARGRSYARKGQVVDLTISPGEISAIVQGSREQPYRVEIVLQKIESDSRKTLVEEMRTRPVYAAALLRGELHPDIEFLFQKKDVPLFPTKTEGTEAKCSCPDSSNLCKHIAAIFYLISEELERDPFLLLLLRGIQKEQLVPNVAPSLFATEEIEPLPTDAHQFWKTTRPPVIPVSLAGSEKRNSIPAILQRLGSFPFWRGENDFLRTLHRIYEACREEERNRKTRS